MSGSPPAWSNDRIECVSQNLHALDSDADPIATPGKLWKELFERNQAFVKFNPTEKQPNFPVPEMGPTVDFMVRSLGHLRNELVKNGGSAQVHLIEALLASASTLKLKHLPLNDTLSFATHYSLLASQILHAVAESPGHVGTVTQVELSSGERLSTLFVYRAREELEKIPRFRFPVLVHRDFTRLDAVRGSAYPLSWISVTDKVEHADGLVMPPYYWNNHDWGHFVLASEPVRNIVHQIGDRAYLNLLPQWDQNVKRMLTELHSLPAGPLKESIEIVAFELTHEYGLPPSARFWPGMEERYFGLIAEGLQRKTLLEQLTESVTRHFYGDDLNYGEMNPEILNEALTWLTRRLP